MVTRNASLLAALALSLCNPQIVAAQVSPQGNVTYRSFGNRTLGQPFVPRSSTFGGGIQTGPTGDFLFLGRPDGSAAFAAPWRLFDPTTIEQAAAAMFAAQPAPTTAVSSPETTAENRVPEFLVVPASVLPLLSETNGPEGMAAVVGPPPASQITIPHVGAPATPASQHGEQAYARSAALSETLTGFARDDEKINQPVLRWSFTGLDASLRKGTLHLEVAAHQRGTASTTVLRLEPLRLYRLTLDCRRGPGCGLNVAITFVDADGKSASRNMVFQLACGPRPSFWPLAPFRQEYVQQFCLPPGAHDATLQVSLTGHPEAEHNFVDLYDVSLAGGARVPFGTQFGPDLLHWNDLRSANDHGGLPLGWGTWGRQAEKMEFVPTNIAARSQVRIGPGLGFILAAPEVPIEPGRAYRVSFQARGKADLGIGIHALEHVNPYPLRVGDPQVKPLHIDAAAWTTYESLWFAESLYAASGQLFISINARTELRLGDISLRRIGP